MHLPVDVSGDLSSTPGNCTTLFFLIPLQRPPTFLRYCSRKILKNHIKFYVRGLSSPSHYTCDTGIIFFCFSFSGVWYVCSITRSLFVLFVLYKGISSSLSHVLDRGHLYLRLSKVGYGKRPPPWSFRRPHKVRLRLPVSQTP